MESPRSLPSPWLGHALVAASALQAAGIPAQIADYHMVSLYPHLEFGSYRPRILIPPSCAKAALSVLGAARTVDFEPLYPCPDCARETRRRRRIVSMLLLGVLGAFFPFARRARRCESCHINIKAAPVAAFTTEELGYDPAPPWPNPWALIVDGFTRIREARYR